MVYHVYARRQNGRRWGWILRGTAPTLEQAEALARNCYRLRVTKFGASAVKQTTRIVSEETDMTAKDAMMAAPYWRYDLKEERTMLDLATLHLESGSHPPDDGLCLLEAAARLAGEPHSDSPSCVCPVVAAFGRALNDRLPDDTRQQLVAALPAMLHTAGDPARSRRRVYWLADQACRVWAPLALEAAGLTEQAGALRRLAPVVDRQSAADANAAADAYAAAAAAANAAAANAAYAAANAGALDLAQIMRDLCAVA